jgi:hypothetical protein
VVLVAGAKDRVARRLAAAIERRGRDALLLDGHAASRLFTIRVSGRCHEVIPELSLFIRQGAWWSDQPRIEPDERFAASESYAALWSVAALSSQPVINRPHAEGWIPAMTAARIQSLLPPGSDQGLAEVFASSPRFAAREPVLAGQAAPADERLARDPPQAREQPPASRQPTDGPVLWGESVEGLTGPAASLPEGVPLRARLVDPQAAYEIVTVVGDRAFSATEDPRTREFGLLDRSVQLAQRARVHFATVTWSVGTDVAPVRLNPNAGLRELRYSWAETEDALCADLTA